MLNEITKGEVERKRELKRDNGFSYVPTGNKLSSVLPLLHPDCQSLPEPNLLPGQLSHGAVGMHGGKVRWLSMAFESVSLFIFHLSSFYIPKVIHPAVPDA